MRSYLDMRPDSFSEPSRLDRLVGDVVLVSAGLAWVAVWVGSVFFLPFHFARRMHWEADDDMSHAWRHNEYRRS